jgi:hypothetical protein
MSRVISIREPGHAAAHVPEELDRRRSPCGARGPPHRGIAIGATLKYVPYQDLTLLDPIQSPAGATLQHSCRVFDTLYGTGARAQTRLPPSACVNILFAATRSWLNCR